MPSTTLMRPLPAAERTTSWVWVISTLARASMVDAEQYFSAEQPARATAFFGDSMARHHEVHVHPVKTSAARARSACSVQTQSVMSWRPFRMMCTTS